MSIFEDGKSREAAVQAVYASNFIYLDRDVATLMERLIFPYRDEKPFVPGDRVVLSQKGRKAFRSSDPYRGGVVTNRKTRFPGCVSVRWDGNKSQQTISTSFLQHGCQK